VVLPTDLHGTSSSTSCRIQGRRPCSRTGSKAAALLTRSSIRVLRLLGAPRDGGRLAGGGSRSRPPSSPDPPPTVEREREESLLLHCSTAGGGSESEAAGGGEGRHRLTACR
jgi:hypothetical protein